MQILAGQKATLKAAIAHQRKRLKNMKPQQELIYKFIIMYMAQKIKPLAAFQIRCSFVPPPYPPCTAPLEELKQIYFKDLRLETIIAAPKKTHGLGWDGSLASLNILV
jgi:hypothetical protein